MISVRECYARMGGICYEVLHRLKNEERIMSVLSLADSHGGSSEKSKEATHEKA